MVMEGLQQVKPEESDLQVRAGRYGKKYHIAVFFSQDHDTQYDHDAFSCGYFASYSTVQPN